MRIALTVTAIGLSASMAAADVISFEGVAPAGGLFQLPIDSPYTEAGFVFTPANPASAIFDATNSVDMPGNSASSFLGWGGGNSITMARTDSTPFALIDLLLGPSSLASGAPTITLNAYFSGGGTAMLTYSGLTTATLVSPGWTNLDHVVFQASMDAAIDNLTVAVPAPAAAAPLALAGLLTARRRRRCA